MSRDVELDLQNQLRKYEEFLDRNPAPLSSTVLQSKISSLRKALLGTMFTKMPRVASTEPAIIWGASAIHRILTRPISLTSYEMSLAHWELNDRGRGIFRGFLYDLGEKHEDGYIHGNISIDTIMVSSSARKIKSLVEDVTEEEWRGYLSPDDFYYFGEADESADRRKKWMEETNIDFRDLADAINKMFILTGENIPDEVTHLLTVLRNPNQTLRIRGLIYCHPCTMSLTRKEDVITELRMVYWREPDCQEKMEEFSLKVNRDKAKEWSMTLNRFPVSPYKTTIDIAESHWKGHSRAKAMNGWRLYPVLRILGYIRALFGHCEGVTLEEKRRAAVVLFPNFLSFFLEANLTLKVVKLHAYDERFGRLVKADKKYFKGDEL